MTFCLQEAPMEKQPVRQPLDAFASTDAVTLGGEDRRCEEAWAVSGQVFRLQRKWGPESLVDADPRALFLGG